MSTSATLPRKDRKRPYQRRGDRVFSGAALAAGSLILLVLAGVAAFLVYEAWPAITASADELPGDQSLVAYVAPLIFGTLLSAAIALLLATPVAVGIVMSVLLATQVIPERTRIAPWTTRFHGMSGP